MKVILDIDFNTCLHMTLNKKKNYLGIWEKGGAVEVKHEQYILKHIFEMS